MKVFGLVNYFGSYRVEWVVRFYGEGGWVFFIFLFMFCLLVFLFIGVYIFVFCQLRFVLFVKGVFRLECFWGFQGILVRFGYWYIFGFCVQFLVSVFYNFLY